MMQHGAVAQFMRQFAEVSEQVLVVAAGVLQRVSKDGQGVPILAALDGPGEGWDGAALPNTPVLRDGEAGRQHVDDVRDAKQVVDVEAGRKYNRREVGMDVALAVRAAEALQVQQPDRFSVVADARLAPF